VINTSVNVVPNVATYSAIRERSKVADYITVSEIKIVDGRESRTVYDACLWINRKPAGKGVEYADKVLVDSISPASESYESCLALAKKRAPHAIVLAENEV
jgi:hypothetical protein